MKLLIALIVSLGLEAYTYHDSLEFLANNISFSFGINYPQSATITTAVIALVKLVIICALLDFSKARSNLLVLLLAVCAFADCFLLTLFLNSSMYAILFNISGFFGDLYRAVEVVCIVSLIFDAVYILCGRNHIPSTVRNRDKNCASVRRGNKV